METSNSTPVSFMLHIVSFLTSFLVQEATASSASHDCDWSPGNGPPSEAVGKVSSFPLWSGSSCLCPIFPTLHQSPPNWALPSASTWGGLTGGIRSPASPCPDGLQTCQRPQLQSLVTKAPFTSFFLSFSFLIFFITVNIQYYFVLVSGEQHSGYAIIYFRK